VPDHSIQGITDVSALLNTLLRPEPAKTVTLEIQKQRQDLLELPNVTFAKKRVTKGDKDKAVGRFKLIERELAARDLRMKPQSIPKSRERQYFGGTA
jgi:hypothetical protein